MKYKWIIVKNDNGEYKKIKCFVLEEKKVEKPKYKIIKKANRQRE